MLPSLWHRNDLRQLARYFGTDKEGAHFYAGHYQHHFESRRHRVRRVLEIGVGGLEDPRAGGESLRMWKAYFRRAAIVGIDIYDKSFHDEHRITTIIGSQADEAFLRRVHAEHGPFDIIIDDGSHFVEHVLTTFKVLFPLLAPDGIYAVEDTQTSYWPEARGIPFGGSTDLNAPHTSMNFLKSLVDGLNHVEFLSPDYVPSYYDKHVVGLHFYHNLVFVYKGVNDEGSEFLRVLRE
ncbi:MAG: class I SAM-dependent methyltransferase [Vicinamibacterales bacterium]